MKSKVFSSSLKNLQKKLSNPFGVKCGREISHGCLGSSVGQRFPVVLLGQSLWNVSYTQRDAGAGAGYGSGFRVPQHQLQCRESLHLSRFVSFRFRDMIHSTI